jgi:hypothetical protein
MCFLGICWADESEEYLLSKDKLSRGIVDTVESKATVSQKALLESYDGAARLRPMWDSIASRYDAVIVPSTVDEAQRGLEYTGDSVSTYLPLLSLLLFCLLPVE